MTSPSNQKKNDSVPPSGKQLRSKSADLGKGSTPLHTYPAGASENNRNSEASRNSPKTNSQFTKRNSEPILIPQSTAQIHNKGFFLF